MLPQQLREIVLTFLPQFEALPASLQLSDFAPTTAPTERDFRAYMHHVQSFPVQLVEGEAGHQYIYLSGVTVLFTDSLLHSIRLAQRETKESQANPLSDERADPRANP